MSMETMTLRTKYAQDITAGDIIVFLGTNNLVETIEPPKHSDPEWVLGRARAHDGWGITLTTGARLTVAA